MSEAALCEQLPFWEFEQNPIPHAILSDGSLSAGIELLPLDIECFDESRINQLTLGLRAFTNSLPESTTAQFLVKVESDVEQVLEKHCSLVSTDNEFLRGLDQKRSEHLKKQIHAEEIWRPRLFFFLRTSGVKRPSSFSFAQTKKIT